MSCERCAARPAKLKYTELRDGKSRVLWICEECARELGFGHGPESDDPEGDEAGTGAELPEASDSPREAPPAKDPDAEEDPAAEADPSSEPPPSLQKIVFGVLGVKAGPTGSEGAAEAVPGDEFAAVRCEGCGITGAELRDRTLLGCPRCYETFERPLDDLLLRLHGALDHAGRMPGGAIAVPPDPKELHRQLDEAIQRQDFEAAARLRDRLRRVRGRPE